MFSLNSILNRGKPKPTVLTSVEVHVPGPDGWDDVCLTPPPMYCDQCNRQASWLSNEFAPVAGWMLCGTCHRKFEEKTKQPVWD